jgi:hypothetical protein
MAPIPQAAIQGIIFEDLVANSGNFFSRQPFSSSEVVMTAKNLNRGE